MPEKPNVRREKALQRSQLDRIWVQARLLFLIASPLGGFFGGFGKGISDGLGELGNWMVGEEVYKKIHEIQNVRACPSG
jgi:hypothetical protein